MQNKSILVINPNSSKSISDTLASLIQPPKDFTYDFFTAPDSSPKEIDSYTTEITSCNACLPEIIKIIHNYDAFLVACYSDHPLVHALKEHVNNNQPVLGIFQASVLHSLTFGVGKFAIVTTADIWEKLLDDAVYAYLGTNANVLFYAGTITTGLGVLELHDADPELVKEKIGKAAKEAVSRGAKVICLGCAGMTGLDKCVRDAVGPNIKIVDGVSAGCEILVALVRSQSLIA